MKSHLASIRGAGGIDRVNRAVVSLRDAWQRYGGAPLKHLWVEERGTCAADSADSVGLLAELVKADLRCRFEKGEAPTVAGYLEQYPELRSADSRVVSLVFEEYCLNEEKGQPPDVEAFCDRYPDWKSSLVAQLKYHRFFSQAVGKRPALPPFPVAGEVFEEFRLLALLGSGGTSRVFLAKDLSLGGKRVVLKVTLDLGQEPKVQGPLEHPHIVPVNSVVYQSKGKLCGLSMPYRPGLPLDKVIARVDPAKKPSGALALWDAVVAGVRESTPPSLLSESDCGFGFQRIPAAPRGDGWEGFPVQGTYAQGVAWIVMIFARALHYAHLNQTFHRDVKPANLLLTMRNGPQLLDFNLADSPHSAKYAEAALHGGTLPYMAPEQIEAFINPELWGKVEARADVYSLGLVFRELLTGEKPELPNEKMPEARAFRAVLDRRPLLDVSVRRFNPVIPHALEAIVAKCLAFAPDDRYPDAESLEQDLDRFLRHLPLKAATNTSHREQAANWLVRKRRQLSGVACALVLCTTLYGLWSIRPVSPPRIESTPAFQEAVHAFNDKDMDRAAERFLNLERLDGNSCLVKFYLGFALKDHADENQKSLAEKYLILAMAPRDAESTMVAWAQSHREVVAPLYEFAESRINEADKAGEDFDYGSPVPDEKRDKAIRLDKYKQATDALTIAEKLDPNFRDTQRLLARKDQFFGEFGSAYDRLSRLIATIKADKKSDSQQLFRAWNQRLRLVFLWADRERRAGIPSDQMTLGRLRESQVDADFCQKYILSNPFRFDDGQMRNYHFLHDKVRGSLTLAEVESELSSLDDARKTYRRAARCLSVLRDYIESNNLTKVPKTDDLEQRLNHLDAGLKVLAINGKVRSPQADRAAH